MITRKQLQAKLVKATCGCDIQYKGFPCNTCFHYIDLPLKEHIHEYWLAVLSFRGDYPNLPPRPDLIKELFAALEAEGKC